MRHHGGGTGYARGVRPGSIALATALHAALIAALFIPHGRKVSVQDVVYSVQMMSMPVIAPAEEETTEPSVSPVTPAVEKSTAPSAPAKKQMPFPGADFTRSLGEKLAGVRGNSRISNTGRTTTAAVKIPRLEITPAATTSRPRLPTGGTLSAAGDVPGWYLDVVLGKIRTNWRVEKRLSFLSADISLRLFRDGRIESVVVERSSGDARFDASAVEAVRRTGNIPAFPETIRKAYLDITINFSPEE